MDIESDIAPVDQPRRTGVQADADADLTPLGPFVDGERTLRIRGSGRLRLGTGATACIYLLPPVLRALRQKFPALEIVVSTGNSPEIVAALEANSIDVALVTLPAPGPYRLVVDAYPLAAGPQRSFQLFRTVGVGGDYRPKPTPPSPWME